MLAHQRIVTADVRLAFDTVYEQQVQRPASGLPKFLSRRKKSPAQAGDAPLGDHCEDLVRGKVVKVGGDPGQFDGPILAVAIDDDAGRLGAVRRDDGPVFDCSDDTRRRCMQGNTVFVLATGDHLAFEYVLADRHGRLRTCPKCRM